MQNIESNINDEYTNKNIEDHSDDLTNDLGCNETLTNDLKDQLLQHQLTEHQKGIQSQQQSPSHVQSIKLIKRGGYST